MNTKQFAVAGRTQAGFTLIELIMVIVILGILSAVALPRFQDLSQNARIATLNGVQGGVAGAMSVAHSVAIIQGQTGATGSVTLEGKTVNLVYGYPDASANGMALALNLVAPTSGSGQVTGAAVTTTTPHTYTYTLTNAPTPASCLVTYTEAANASTPPLVAVTSGGC